MKFESDNLARRRFLQSAVLLSSAAFAGRAQADEPAATPPKDSSPHMRLSLAAYSFNRFLPNTWRGAPKPDAKMSLEDFIRFCAEQNLDGTELTAYYFPTEVSDSYLLSLKQLTFRLGLTISGTAIGNDFCVADTAALEAELERTKRWIDYSSTMGAPVIRIFAGNVAKGDTEEAAIERCADTIDRALQYAATKGVFLALENHGGITATPEQMLKIIEKVKPSPWFGVNFDGGNFRTDDPYRDLEKIAPLAINAQIKVVVAPEGKKQPADFARVIEILKRANYRGFVALEYEEPEDPWTEIPKHLASLRELIYG
jgi:sugar phosphate isomerase/epimerase